MAKHEIVCIKGDGVGPEVIEATCKAINATGVSIQWIEAIAGAEVFKSGLATGVPLETLEKIRKTKVALKGPLETPVGFGEKSANVTLRKQLETFGNIRPVKVIPGIQTPYSDTNLDFIIVRENLEDLYAGIEYQPSADVATAIKLISRTGSERIIRLAFELAKSEGRKKVHGATKANILKLTEGLFKRVFEDVAKDYPEIKAEHIIVDNCAHMMVKNPEMFDVVVMTNMNGDILSDLASGLVGGLGVAAGANLGHQACVFEAVHGSAPDIAGKDLVNPMAVMLSGVMMLKHIGETEAAMRLEASIYHTISVDRIQTCDLMEKNYVGTRAFTDAIIHNLSNLKTNTISNWEKLNIPNCSLPEKPMEKQELVGVDIFFIGKGAISNICENMKKSVLSPWQLKLIAAKGLQLYPGDDINTDGLLLCARFICNNPDDTKVNNLLEGFSKTQSWTSITKLYNFAGKPGFTKVHGEE